MKTVFSVLWYTLLHSKPVMMMIDVVSGYSYIEERRCGEEDVYLAGTGSFGLTCKAKAQ